MIARDIEKLTQLIGQKLRGHRSAVMRETLIHDSIAAALADLHVTAEREFRLTKQSRLDFWLPTTSYAIEVKKGNAASCALVGLSRRWWPNAWANAPTICLRWEWWPLLMFLRSSLPLARVR